MLHSGCERGKGGSMMRQVKLQLGQLHAGAGRLGGQLNGLLQQRLRLRRFFCLGQGLSLFAQIVRQPACEAAGFVGIQFARHLGG